MKIKFLGYRTTREKTEKKKKINDECTTSLFEQTEWKGERNYIVPRVWQVRSALKIRTTIVKLGKLVLIGETSAIGNGPSIRSTIIRRGSPTKWNFSIREKSMRERLNVGYRSSRCPKRIYSFSLAKNSLATGRIQDISLNFVRSSQVWKGVLKLFQADCLAIERRRGEEVETSRENSATKSGLFARVSRSNAAFLLRSHPPRPPPEIRLSRERGFIIDAVTPSSSSSRLLVRSSLLLLHGGRGDAPGLRPTLVFRLSTAYVPNSHRNSACGRPLKLFSYPFFFSFFFQESTPFREILDAGYLTS